MPINAIVKAAAYRTGTRMPNALGNCRAISDESVIPLSSGLIVKV